MLDLGARNRNATSTPSGAAMKRLLILVLFAGLTGCAGIAALPIAAKIGALSTVAVGTGAVVMDGVNAVHDCHQDKGCTHIPVPK